MEYLMIITTTASVPDSNSNEVILHTSLISRTAGDTVPVL